MARHKGIEWNLPDGSLSYDAASLAVQMDIRDELRRLNDLLHCVNFVGIPFKLDKIVQNTTKPKRKKKKVA